MMTTLALALSLACLAAPRFVVGAETSSDGPPGTLLEKYSIANVGGGKVPFWTLGESAKVTGKDVVLIGKTPKAKGTLWTSEACHADQWEAQFEMTVTGDSESPGKGFAFWYTTSAMQPGILFGSEERYEGFGLLFDSHDDDGKNDNPIIMGWVNDGTKVFNHDTDGLGTRFGGCRAKYRNRGNKVGVKVTYQHDTLKVLLDMRNNGVWERCLVKDNIYLSSGSYFGFSAANTAEKTGDEIKVVNMKVYDLETKESIKKEDEEIKEKEEQEKKKSSESGEIHNLAEQMTGMQKDLHEEFLQKISDMIQRDHVTASHEFRSIRQQLTDAVEEAKQPNQQIASMKEQITTLQSTLEQTQRELKELQSAAKGNTGGNSGGADLKGKFEEFSQTVKAVREQMVQLHDETRNQHTQSHEDAVNSIKEHAGTLHKAMNNVGGSSWIYVVLFQVVFLVALVLWKRSGGGEGKQHMV